ncbi:MAG: branched-chain amino acid ABC transporter permease [Defluviitaleaceae bacterium]|nr:branched-chain amino acid ABC transporter permease [Defluviitaleaceae bacterium]
MLQVTVNGLLIGGVYALIAVGLTMIHGVMKIVNFAQGDFLVIGLYLTYVFYQFLPDGALPYWLILPVAASMYLIGCIIFKLSINRVIGQGDSNYILLTIGLSFVIQNMLQLMFGANFRSVPISNELRFGSFEMFGTIFTIPRVIAFCAAALFVVFVNWFLSRTDVGRAMRATSENRVVAESLGIRTSRIYVIAFALGTMFAGVSGLLLSPMFLVFPTLGAAFSTVAMSAIVLGGLGNIKGALLGGIIIGLVESFVSTYISVTVALAGINLVLMLVLIFRPYGLLGKRRRTA